ncbi:hypothetical protein MNBD_GAMMA01-890 [hydrothermal vent metagenome]|uniref:DUF11 domain-containing protein n=1 Tax=hydrothermal vent metagenome TaxID=652676 RepID=A0A3B0USU7_9ZZZZ
MVCWSVLANKDGEQITEILSAITNNNSSQTSGATGSIAPNSSVTLDFSITTAESWDGKNQPKNVIVNCINGEFITGFEYSNLTLTTVGGSYLSEAVIYFSDSTNGDDGIRLTAGVANESSGTGIFNSDGILDLTDTGNVDIVSLQNNQFNIQFYEIIDDAVDAIDARFTNGTLTVWGVDLVATDSCQFVAGKTGTDLSVEYTIDSTGFYRIGDSLEFDLAINNNGGIAATNVVLANTLSTKLQFTEMSCDDGTNTTDVADIAMMGVQDIAANSSLQCVLNASIVSAGQIINSVTVTADNDSDTGNNFASLAIGGAVAIIPVNNLFALVLLVFGLLFFARKRILSLIPI